MGQIRMKASRIIPNLQLCGIVDENIENAKKFGDQYEIPYAKDLKSFIQVKNVTYPFIMIYVLKSTIKPSHKQTEGPPDGIWISTPTPTHQKLIEYAASQCIPIATEKPVGMFIFDNNIDLIHTFDNRLCIHPCTINSDGSINNREML